MSGISLQRGRWTLNWRENGTRMFRYFDTRELAKAYREANGISPAQKRGKKSRTRAEVINQIASQFEVADNGCWLWQGHITNAGYGRMSWKRGDLMTRGAHRIALEAIGEAVPTDLVVDHLCRQRNCVNPDHLEVVTGRENVMRSDIAVGSINARKTHCVNGHPYSEENTYTYTFRPEVRKATMRRCRTCYDASRRRTLARRRGEAIPIRPPSLRTHRLVTLDEIEALAFANPDSQIVYSGGWASLVLPGEKVCALDEASAVTA